MRTFFDIKVIRKFYGILNFSGFNTIAPERVKEIDEITDFWRPIFINNTVSLRSLMHYTAEKMITSSKNYGLTTGEEIAYFYIKIIDPDFYFLEASECANTMDDMKDLCFKNFGIYDAALIKLEKTFNDRFNAYDPDDLWSRDRIKK